MSGAAAVLRGTASVASAAGAVGVVLSVLVLVAGCGGAPRPVPGFTPSAVHSWTVEVTGTTDRWERCATDASVDHVAHGVGTGAAASGAVSLIVLRADAAEADARRVNDCVVRAVGGDGQAVLLVPTG